MNNIRTKLQSYCHTIVSHKYFDRFIVFVIAVNSLFLAMADYSNVDENGTLVADGSWRNSLISQSEILFTAIFTIECGLKIISFGFSGKEGYLHDPWNWLDFIVVITGWISYLPGLPNISVIRTFRVIRPLKSISSNPGLQHLVSSILNSIPQLVGVLILLLFVFTLFGIAGVQLFSGPQFHTRCRYTPYPVKLNWTLGLPYSSYRCLDAPNFDLLDEENWKKSDSPWSTPQDCYWPVDPTQLSFCSLNNEGMYKCLHDTDVIPPTNWTWCGSNYDARGNPRFISHQIMNEPTFIAELNWGYANYDNILEAFLTVFQVITLEGWTTLMFFAQDSVNQYYAVLLYVSLILFGAFFCLNLLLAVLEDNFTHSTTDSNTKGTWKLFILHWMIFLQLHEYTPPPWYGTLQNYCRTIVDSIFFNHLITLFIVLNTLVLALDYYPQDLTFSHILDLCNFIFSLLFLFEMFIKIVSYNLFFYLSDLMNILDGIIVITSFIELINSPPVYLTGNRGGDDVSTSGSISALRGFRLFRIFKLISKWESMRLILLKVFKTVKDLGNFALLLFLILFIYSLIGMQFFANRFHFDSNGYPITTIGSDEWRKAHTISRSNFDDFTHAFATVFQVLTTENWNNVMYDCRKVAGMAGVIFPCSLIIIGDYIFMNLFLAILIGNFADNEITDPHLASELSSSDDSAGEEVVGHRGGGGGERGRVKGGGGEVEEGSQNNSHSNTADDPTNTNSNTATATGTGTITITMKKNKKSLLSILLKQNRVSPVKAAPSFSNTPLQRLPSNESFASQQDSIGDSSSLPSRQPPHQHPHHTSPNTDEMDSNNEVGSVGGGHEETGLHESDNDEINDHDHDHDGDGDESITDLEIGVVSSPATESIFPLYPSYTLFLFGPDHPLRHFCAHLISNKKFDQFILILITISSISLALDNPLSNPTSLESQILSWFDLILTLLFTVEMCIKIIALGFLFDESAYLRSSWNILDFIVVLISFISTFSGTNSSLSSLRSLRALRALRPLRVINRAPGLKLVVNSMLASIPDVMNVLALCLLFFIIFAIFSVNYFQGMLRSCTGEIFRQSIKTNHQYLNLLTHPKYWQDLTMEEKSWFGPTSNVTVMDCSEYNYPEEPCCSSFPLSHHQPITSRMICECWSNQWEFYSNYQFDNVLQALFALFQMSTTEGWVDLMYTLVDTSGIDMQPIHNHQIQWIYFCIFFMVIGSYLALNIFVGVVIDNFNKMKAKVDGNLAFLTPEQQEWIRTQEIIKRLRPIKKPPRPTLWLTGLIYDICYHNWFEWFILYCILTNTITMAMVYYGQDDLYGSFLNTMNTIFAFVFTIETILKIITLKFHYFEDHWNKFDFLVVLGTNIGLLYLYISGSKIGLVITILRTFRIARLIRLMNGTEKINQLLNTLLLTLPGLGNIAALLFLLFFIYGVMGVQLFAKIQFYGSYNRYTNFRDFGTGLLSLLRFSTGESWNDFMYDASRHTEGCVPNPTYNSSYCGFNDHVGCIPLNGCGSTSIFPFMISFTVIITVVFINLFVGVILEGFSSADSSEKTVKPEDYMRYCEHWAQYDPHATCYITLDQLESFIFTLFEPLGFESRREVSTKEIQDRISAMNLHVFSRRRVHFRDVLSGLSTEAIKRAALQKTETALPISPMKKFGWSGFHSKVLLKKKKVIDPYLGIAVENPSCPSSSTATAIAAATASPTSATAMVIRNPQIPYTPDQFYAVRRVELQMSRLNLTISKKRVNPNGCESPFIPTDDSKLPSSSATSPPPSQMKQNNPIPPSSAITSTPFASGSVSASASGLLPATPLPEYSKNRVLVKLRSQSEKDKNSIQDDGNNILNRNTATPITAETMKSNDPSSHPAMIFPEHKDARDEENKSTTNSNSYSNPNNSIIEAPPARLPPITHITAATNHHSRPPQKKTENPILPSHRKKGTEHLEI